jgi:lipopolysaccharide biosynthesis glycosyltransferase
VSQAPTALCFTPDRRFFAPAVRTIASLVAAGDADAFDIFIFCEEADVEPGFEDLDPALRAQIHLETLDFSALDAGLAPKGRFSRAVFRRLFLDRLLPDAYARYVAIDADMLIARPGLAALASIDLGPHAFAAAYDMIFLMDFKGGPLAREFQGYRRALGLDLTTPYFNAGLMTVDRARWRAAGYANEAATRLRSQPEKYPFMEQDALNSLVQGEFAPLSPRLNFMGDFFLTGLEPEIAPIVWHFVNQPKPWDYADWRGEGRFARAYRDWFAQGPFPAWRPTGAAPPARRKPAATALRRRFAENLRDFLARSAFVDV